MKLTVSFLWTALLVAAPAASQFEDPQRKIKEIANEIAGELQEIDRLLLQTGQEGGAKAAAEGMARAAQRIDDLLEQTAQSQEAAAKRMDELIKEIEKLSGQCSGCSECNGQGHGKQSQQPQQRSQRQPSSTPDAARPDEPDGDKPQDNRSREEPGQNAPADAERQDPTQRVDHERTFEKWGNLPDYLEFLKSRGGQPDVPEKYRKFRDAFLKQSQKSEGSAR